MWLEQRKDKTEEMLSEHQRLKASPASLAFRGVAICPPTTVP
jgi:hypothetical protein